MDENDTSQTTFSPYDYKDLKVSGSYIRLLQLHPAAGFDDLIEITITVEAIEEKRRRYDAISYRWGDANDRCRILLNGADCWITRSLHSALQHFRNADNNRLIWADGICIDQSNNTERSQQVALMGQIYFLARTVRIFLGEASQDTEAGMGLIKDCSEASSNKAIVDRILEDELGSIALTELLSRGYWQRMWVFQEIILGSEVVIHCGSYEAPWEGLVKLDKVSGEGRYWFQSQVRSQWIRNLRKALLLISQFCILPSQAQHLINVLLPTRRLEASDPRDKLFALLGVSRFGETLRADYTKTTAEIYMSFSQKYMEQEFDLSLLLMSGLCQSNNRSDIGLPSWTPDYRGLEGIDIRYLAASYLRKFEAAAGYERTIVFNGRTMDVKGTIIGQIDNIFPLVKGEDSRRDVLLAFSFNTRTLAPGLYKDIFETMIFHEATMSSSVTDSGVAWRRKKKRISRLILGFAWDLQCLLGDKASAEMPPLVLGFLNSFGSSGLSGLGKKYRTFLSKNPDALHWCREEYLSRYEEGFQEASTTAFSTTNVLVGKGPGVLKKGDTIAVIFGCRVPLALRAVDEHQKSFHLVGPCYASGIMDGQALRDTGETHKPRMINLV